MRKLQEEIERVVGLEQMVEESDFAKLKYLDIGVKEGFRIHPAALLMAPHMAMEDCVVMGYDIPKNLRVIMNVWAIGRDMGSWTDPEEFIPERFMDLNADVHGTDFRVIPFGSGRRRFPGVHLGMVFMRLVTAQLVLCFDQELLNSMSQEHGLGHGGGVLALRASQEQFADCWISASYLLISSVELLIGI
ncbi:Cytochrome P450 98A1 [Acorus gramineus]|uniref:Cytochrome P450 98A1 n=1 Tax=Acorus gramineus TaxID=55184 RepID=A0AAV9ACA3_ACOGR|nr:Cytochrome P450 98A1 [Acorus gramineus]